ncbi:ABC transporter permease [Sinorhizobium meliloti]|uniref:ABC transporter permease n=1 Tax=Rhizobium meliloti TaxID=382 RepID=UPI0012979EA5|nr:ABC transporter permease subunit [Sinorhizobium meliloti]MQU68394.1 ABC transporter permease subunit [Sinorhizobium meliloti]
MTSYSGLFNGLGLREWCNAGATEAPESMADLLAKVGTPKGSDATFPFPSLDNLHEACHAVPRTRDVTAGLERLFLNVKDPIKVVLDPLTQPLSWMLQNAISGVQALPWWLSFLVLLAIVQIATRRTRVTIFVCLALSTLAFFDHFDFAMQTLAIIIVCTAICVVLGVPIGILMSRSNRVERSILPLLDLLQTLPSFVYLIPLIFLFSVTEPKLYGIAIVLYAIVPIVRLTNLGIRLVDRDIVEAAEAYGMTTWQKLMRVELPLALPNIMAGLNQTIMMSLSMVVIASLVSAPGLGTLVLRGINKLELGVGLVAGLGIVLLAIVLDRVSKASLERISLHKLTEGRS